MLQATDTAAPSSTPARAITNTPSPAATQTLLATLPPDRVKETMQPLLQDPMNCANLCFLGITPGKTTIGQIKAFFSPLGLQHLEGTDPNSGRDFYSFRYETDNGLSTGVTLYMLNNLIENIVVTPEITKQKDGSAREWIAYSPETLIKKYGKPSRVEFGVDSGQLVTINRIMYFDSIDLIALYAGIDNTFRLCPFTYPFHHVRLWMGAKPPNSPQFPTVSLEEAASLTIDQFSQLMLGDPQNACFQLNQDAFLDK